MHERQKQSATANCAADHSTNPSGTPASGTSTLPTTGTTSAGVRLAHARPPGWLPRHHFATTHAVTRSCAMLPIHQAAAAAGVAPASATAAVASRMREIGIAATKGWRTGCAKSSRKASGKRRARCSENTASATKTKAAAIATTSATPPAISPMAGAARCQASARPVRPITTANQPGMRNLRGVGWAGMPG